jgi:DNA-binding MarR family transcriptional regulator
MDVVPTAMKAMRRAMRARVGEGLSVPQFRCLNYIDRHAGASVGQVANFLGVSLATASVMVDRLKLAGHVDGSVSAADRRRSVLQSSSAGRSLLSVIRDATQAEFAELLRRHTGPELATLLEGMQLLKLTFRPE